MTLMWHHCNVTGHHDFWSPFAYQIDGLVQERRNSIANALELRLSCTNPSRWCHSKWSKRSWYIFQHFRCSKLHCAAYSQWTFSSFQRSTLQYDGLHDRPLKHYFSPHDIRVALTNFRVVSRYLLLCTGLSQWRGQSPLPIVLIITF